METADDDRIKDAFFGCLGREDLDYKRDVIERLPYGDHLLEDLVSHVLQEIELHPRYNNGARFEFTKEEDARKALEDLATGWLFECIAKKELSSEFNQGQPQSDISDLLMDVCRNPGLYGISPGKIENARIPDGIFVRFVEGTLMIEDLVEATSGPIGKRKILQLGVSGGSRSTMTLLVKEINSQIRANSANERLAELIAKISESETRTLGVSPDIGIRLVVTKRDNQYPQDKTNSAKWIKEKGIIDLVGSEGRESPFFKPLFELLEESGVNVEYSKFGSQEVRWMAAVLVDEIYGKVADRIVRPAYPEDTAEVQENNAEELLREQFQEIAKHYQINGNSDDIERLDPYLAWVSKSLITRSVRVGDEIRRNFDHKSNTHRPTGFIRRNGNEGLEEQLNAHLNAWRQVLGGDTDTPVQGVVREQLIEKLIEITR